MGTTGQRINGFDAYETAWDTLSERLWNVLRYNLVWFGMTIVALILMFLLTVGLYGSWPAFLFWSIVLFLEFSPLWEGANIARYGLDPPSASMRLPVAKIIVARLLFLLLVAPAYLLILPGIYLHCRLSLYLPLLVLSPDLTPAGSLGKSWALTRSRFVDLYTLWIAVVVSKPACLLPLGLGFLFERPVSGLAKTLMCRSCSTGSCDGPV